MKLRTRLTLVSSLLIAMASLFIGVFSVNATRTSAFNQIDNTLTQVLNASDGSQAKNQGSTVTRADDLNVAVALGLILPDNSITVVRRAGDVDAPYKFPKLNSSQLAQAAKSFTNVGAEVPYRIRSRALGDGVSLLAAAPLITVNRDIQNLVTKTVGATFLVILLAALLVWWSTRRALRTVDEMIDTATAIAGGELDYQVPSASAHTELGRLGNALSEMITVLRSALRSREESEGGMRRFLGDASHELRTPLTVIKGYAEMLRNNDSIEPEQRHRAIDRLNAESLRMDQLISDLLRISRLDQFPAIAEEFVDFSSVVRDFSQDLRDQEPDRPVTLDIEDDVIVRGDEALLRQVVANIVGNIRKHTPENSSVKFSLSLAGANTTMVVDDSGNGIPQELREKAIARFGRLDESRSRQGGGFGLGLSIIAKVIELHQGLLTLGESPWGGLRLTIELPAVNP